MKLSEFDFKLASTRTALHPATNRDESRLMVVHKDTGKIEHKQFKYVVLHIHKLDNKHIARYVVNKVFTSYHFVRQRSNISR